MKTENLKSELLEVLALPSDSSEATIVSRVSELVASKAAVIESEVLNQHIAKIVRQTNMTREEAIKCLQAQGVI